MSYRSGKDPNLTKPLQYKLHATLPTLDTNNRLAINDWIVNLKAAAGPDFAPIWLETEPNLEYWRRVTNTPAEVYDITDVGVVDDYRLWRDVFTAMSAVAYGWIIRSLSAAAPAP